MNIADPIGIYDVGTGESLLVEHFVDLGLDDAGEPLGLAYTTASHGRLVQIVSGSLRCVFDVDGDMIVEDADRIKRWLNRDDDVVDLIRRSAPA